VKTVVAYENRRITKAKGKGCLGEYLTIRERRSKRMKKIASIKI
jgi:hypothetical protein